MDCICIEIIETGERRRIDLPFWITVNRNGILATPHRCLALGVGDGDQIWRLGELEGYLVSSGSSPWPSIWRPWGRRIRTRS